MVDAFFNVNCPEISAGLPCLLPMSICFVLLHRSHSVFLVLYILDVGWNGDNAQCSREIA